MGRGECRRGRPIDGILLLDKPPGISSNGALQRVKSLFEARKAGHTGNLDIPASGLLPICLGEATKLSGFLLDAPKRYQARCVLGLRTTTGDAEGEVCQRRPVPPLSREGLEEVLAGFLGTITQVPPMHSAIKHQGQPLYKLAHRGVEVERSPRTVTIYELRLIELAGETFVIDVRCSKGTYIRTLAEDIGGALGCGAHVASLRRLAVGPFDVDDAVDLSALEATKAKGGLEALDRRLLEMDSAVAHQPDVALTEDLSYYVTRGQAVVVPHAPTRGWVRLYDAQRRFLGMGQVLDDGRIAPRRLLRNPA